MADQDIPLLDEEVSRLPSDIREDMAEHGRNDLYFFGKGILRYDQMVPHVHRPLCLFFDANPSQYKLVLHPRGTFKTSAVTISRNAQKAVRNPNERICIINEVADNAEGFLGTIRQHFENNRVLRTLYSSVVPKDYRKVTWNNKAIRLNREWMGPEDTLEAMGIMSTLTSHHYTHLGYDDIISEDAVKSPQVMQDTIERARKFRSLMVNPETSTLDIVGTRWALHDAYSYFMNTLGTKLAKYVRGATKPDGTLLFPELLSADTLASLRTEYGEYMYSCLYQNNPRDIANQDFNIQDLRFWRWTADESGVVLYNPDGTIRRVWPIDKLDITVSVDLAVAERINSDCNAVITVGCTPLGEAIVLHEWVKRCTPLEVIEHLLWLRQRFNVRVFGIEGVAYQKAFKYFLAAECERRGAYMNITELKAVPSKRGVGNNSKEMRIRGLQPIAATGRLYILATMHTLRNQLADFPLGEHDDAIDALAHQLTMWRGLLSERRIEKYQESEARLLRRIAEEERTRGTGRSWGAVDPADYIGMGVHPRDIPHPDDLGIELPRFSDPVEVMI